MTTQLVYLFDSAGLHNGEYIAQPSPLEPGAFIVPTNSTPVAPPALAVNQVAVFANGAWSAQPDYRGQLIYDQNSGASQEIVAIGAIPAGFALTPPPPTLAQAKNTQIAKIKNSCEQALQTIVAAYPSLEVATWPNQYAEAQAFTANNTAATPTLSAIAVASGQTVPALASSVISKASAYASTSGSAVGKRQALTAQINAAAGVAAVLAIVW